MTILCVTCSVLRRLRSDQRPRMPETPQVCEGCRTRLAGELTALPSSLGAVYDHLVPGRGAGERRSSGYESKPPINLAAWSLILPGRETPLAVLEFWAQDWAGERSESVPEADTGVIVAWMANRLNWACDHHNAIDEYARDIRAITNWLRPYQPRTIGQPAGTCPRKPADRRCGANLYVDPYQDIITCDRCGATWDRKQGEWTHLRAQQLAAGVDAA